MAVRFSALLLCKPWAPEIFTLNLETCSADCEIPSSIWDRVAVALAPSREQSLMFQLLQEWWHATAATLTKERQVIGPADNERLQAIAVDCGWAASAGATVVPFGSPPTAPTRERPTANRPPPAATAPPRPSPTAP